MRTGFLKYCFIIAFVIYLPVQSMAWGLLGHRIVGEIADQYITAKTRAAIKSILGNESIAMASNWADFIKSDTSYRYLSTWHYINTPKGLNYAQYQDYLKHDTTTDAYTKLNFLIAELKKKSLSLDKKRMYLRLLIHIVGDLHQPLHVSPEGTTGGNDIKVNWFAQATNLHSVWDSYLIEQQQLSYTEYTKAINFTTVAQRQALQKDPIGKWLFESYSIATELHNELTEQNPKLGYLYNFQHLQTVNDQLLKGGVRLAGLLNQIFGK
jgi:hypothetical protein